MIFTIKKEYPLELIRWLVPFDQSRVDLYVDIQDEINNNDSDIFIIRAYDKGEIQAIAIVNNFPSCAWIWQFRCSPHFKYKKEMWSAVRSWVKSKHKDRIEIKTYSKRLERHFERCFGFQKVGDRLVYKIIGVS